MTQQGDVRLFQTNDEGEILVEGGLVAMNGGLETAAYLSLFGGNEDDDGRADNPAQFWGNFSEIQTARQYRSETQYLLKAIPATSGNLRRIEDAARRDLAWFVEARVATSVIVSATIPALNSVALTVEINQERFEFVENWRANA